MMNALEFTQVLGEAAYGVSSFPIDRDNKNRRNLYLHDRYMGFVTDDEVCIGFPSDYFILPLCDPGAFNRVLSAIRSRDASQSIVMSLLDMLRVWWPTVEIRDTDLWVEFVVGDRYICSFRPPSAIYCICYDAQQEVLVNREFSVSDPLLLRRLMEYFTSNIACKIVNKFAATK